MLPCINSNLVQGEVTHVVIWTDVAPLMPGACPTLAATRLMGESIFSDKITAWREQNRSCTGRQVAATRFFLRVNKFCQVASRPSGRFIRPNAHAAQGPWRLLIWCDILFFLGSVGRRSADISLKISRSLHRPIEI
jgi:hypothetical protein